MYAGLRLAAAAFFVLAVATGGFAHAQAVSPAQDPGSAQPAAETASAKMQAAPEFASAAAAQAAADAAKAERAQAVQAYEVRVRECAHKFFVTNCSDSAREERNKAVEQADGTTQRAELFVRQEKARENRERLAAENAKRDARDAEKAAELLQTEAANRAAAPGRKPPGAAHPGTATPRPPAGQPARAARPEDDPAVRARNREAFERKQEEARIYAEKQARERQENEDKRARRRAQREADAAKLNNPGTTKPDNSTMAK